MLTNSYYNLVGNMDKLFIKKITSLLYKFEAIQPTIDNTY